MKAILIDDEKAALVQMERLISKDGRIDVIGAFTTVREGLEYLSTCKADFVFLDIGMPEMSGLTAAEYILQLVPDIRVVYVTAYSEYAIEAFELNALDYLLKPVSATRFAKTVTRMLEIYHRKNSAQSSLISKETEPAVVCFHRLELRGGMTPGTKLKWRTSKAQELFAYLLHNKGQWVSKDLLLDSLWPDYGPDKGMTHLHTSVYQIRKLLREWNNKAIIDFAQDCYRLTLEGSLTDVELFELKWAEAQDELTASNDRLQHLESALRLYSGHYLEEHDYWWAKPRQEQLRQQYITLALAAAKEETSAGRESKAITRLMSARDKDPYSEEICRQILQASANLHDYQLLQSHYQAFEEMLKRELGTEPDSQTTALYEALLQQ